MATVARVRTQRQHASRRPKARRRPDEMEDVANHDVGHPHTGHAHSGHVDGHTHDGHTHGIADASARAIVAACAITTIVFLAELIGGWLSGSIALLADAMHMISDAAGLFIALIAVIAGRRPANQTATFGYRRTEVLAALLKRFGVCARRV